MAIKYQTLAPVDQTVDASRFDLNATGTALAQGSTFVYWDVRGLSTVAIQATKETTWATAVFTLERSMDGRYWWALETPETIPAGGGMSSTIDVTAMAYIRARLSTLEGSQKFAVLTAFGKAGE